MLGCVSERLIPGSDVCVLRVMLAVPLTILGRKVTVPPAGNMIVSGFRSHSEDGRVFVAPEMTSRVAVYGAKFMVEDHAGVVCVIVAGAAADKVYAVTELGVNPFVVNCTWAVL